MTYVRRKAGERVRPVRRFEFNFRLAGLAVVMLHFRGETTGRLHLVEIYHTRWPAPIRWLFETASLVDGQPLSGWRALCVALINHPDFYSY